MVILSDEIIDLRLVKVAITESLERRNFPTLSGGIGRDPDSSSKVRKQSRSEVVSSKEIDGVAVVWGCGNRDPFRMRLS